MAVLEASDARQPRAYSPGGVFGGKYPTSNMAWLMPNARACASDDAARPERGRRAFGRERR